MIESKRYNLKIIKKHIDAKAIMCSIYFTIDPLTLIARSVLFDELKFAEDDAFECLIKLREILEKDNYFILCNGTRIDTYPSGMCRDMGVGFKVYQLQLGQPSKIKNLVNTFDEASLSEVATIQEQYEYYIKWLKSLGIDIV